MHDCRLAVDIGGTFTDVVLEHPLGIASGKVLTTPDAPERGVVDGVAHVLSLTGIGPERISLVVHGTTLATNAIIERRGARTALLTTIGFRDTLEFAHGHRFDQYDLTLARPEPLIERPLRLEVVERMAADGSILLPLDEAQVRTTAAVLRDRGVESVGICLLHAYANGEHERRTREILIEEHPALYVSMSHEVCPEIREYERTTTTIANAYVQPLMAKYLGRLSTALADRGVAAPLLLITSAGSLTSIDTAIRLPIRLVESGPAGGAIFGQHIARQLNAKEAIAFDMGGTTAKIVLVNDYEPRHSRSMEVARAHRLLPGTGIPLRIPVIDMIEIGAGGGSIATIDQLGQIAVGPESAGAAPGPACYCLGGRRPTVTDADLVLGKLDADTFAGGRIKLDPRQARTAIETHVAGPLGLDIVVGSAGITEIVCENMANAIRVHAADNGEQVESRVLIVTGGAAPLHAARIAQKLSISTIVVPHGAGVGSALGFLEAPIAYQAVRTQVMRLEALDPGLVNSIFADLRNEAEAVLGLAATGGRYVERRYADMRYLGQGHELRVEIPARLYTEVDGAVLERAFHEAYRRSYERTIPNLRAQALTWTLVLSVESSASREPALPQPPAREGPRARTAATVTRAVFDAGLGERVEVAVVDRAELVFGHSLRGPALIVEPQTTTYVPPSYSGSISAHGHLVIERQDDP
jgi:N-methylhydantoinase A